MSIEQPTPETVDEFSDDEIEAFNRANEDRLDALLREERLEQNETARQARDALMAAGDEQVDTETVTLPGEVELDVRTTVSGRVERTLVTIDGHATIIEAADDIIGVICDLVEGPEGYDEPAAWYDVHDEHGTAFLFECFEAVTSPALERMEDVQKFRSE